MSHYIRFALEPRSTDVLRIRKALQDALTDTFGITASTFIDVLAVDDQGSHAVVRVHPEDAPKILAAAVASRAALKCRAVKESSFLPSLVSGITP